MKKSGPLRVGARGDRNFFVLEERILHRAGRMVVRWENVLGVVKECIK